MFYFQQLIEARIQRWPVTIYGSLPAKFMETQYNVNIHRYGTPFFDKIVVNISKPIKKIIKYIWEAVECN